MEEPLSVVPSGGQEANSMISSLTFIVGCGLPGKGDGVGYVFSLRLWQTLKAAKIYGLPASRTGIT